MIKIQVKVINEVGLHARPAAIFVQTAKRFTSQIKVSNLTKGSKASDAKSILGILILGVEKDEVIELDIIGDDEVQAADCIKKLIESDFQQGE